MFKDILEVIKSPEFEALPLMFRIVDASFYLRLLREVEKLREQATKLDEETISESDFESYLKTVVLRDDSPFLRASDSYPTFRFSTMWEWYNKWLQQVREPSVTTPTRGRPKKKTN